MCIISLDLHYKTIDGKQINFQGPCKYNLLSRSQSNEDLLDFKIFGKNETRGDNSQVSYPSYFEIHYLTFVIKLKKGGLVTDKLTCDHDPDKRNPDHYKWTFVIPDVEVATNNDIYCSLGGRRFQAIPSDSKYYIDHDADNIKIPCPPGTLFSIRDCLCIHGKNKYSQTKRVLSLDFDDKNHPLKTNQGIYVTWTKASMSLLEAGVEGSALRFNGDRLEIPFYNNKYRRDSGRPEEQILVSNGDCPGEGQASIQLITSPDNIGGGLRANTNELDAFNNIASPSSNWHHDGSRVKFYLDGDLKAKSLFTTGVHCPLLIGSGYDNHFFYGLMDKIRVSLQHSTPLLIWRLSTFELHTIRFRMLPSIYQNMFLGKSYTHLVTADTCDYRMANVLSRNQKHYTDQDGGRLCDYLVYHGYRKCYLKYPDDPCTCNGIVAICAEAMVPPVQDTCRVMERDGALCCRRKSGRCSRNLLIGRELNEPSR
ncbi:hypothetical protein LSH36_1449g00006 [Paralvinella palmiformis]|uniref:VWFD domain-containing protein n=1 Tax=Paralvinella palmiformis TaxID=53620 RepID=A0AAD9MQA1_9ANNE|nr:hypothetical protein LSH36_1449g00006 [Paralvinella palmiformis]